jgi:maltose alpha-D-glucosyltransferase/alpha-amylase
LAAYAEFVPVYAKADTYPFVFARAAGDHILLALFNPADRDVSAGFTLNIGAKTLKLLSGTELKIDIEGRHYTVRMAGQSYSLYTAIQ